MSVLDVDKKNRVLLDKKVREATGFKKGDRLVAIPFTGGVMLVNVKNKSFVGSLTNFKYKEENHEASKLLFKVK
jgi:bifunctional DNA-binding transcriptional regulator/antitoxin component of YhaV-PrlF toxin-antitoxin module